MSLSDISKDDCEIFGRLFVCGLLKNLRNAKFRNNLIPFWKVDEEFRVRGVDYEHQTNVMNKLASAGLFEHVNFQGWQLLPPTETSEPVREGTLALNAEFGHCCHGCAKYPCVKSEKGEPDGDCWDYLKTEG